MNPASYGHTPDEARSILVNNIQIEKLNKNWIRNIQYNLGRVREDNLLSRQLGTWAGKNTIVVGAGPSARENIEYIKDAVARGWKVIAVDRVHGLLKTNGITPDYTISMDSKGVVKDFFTHVDREDKLVMKLKQHTGVIGYAERKAGHVYYYETINPYSPMTTYLYDRLPHEIFCLRTGFVVGFVALDMAIWMGSEKIVLIGNELSWKNRGDVDKMYESTLQLMEVGGRTYYTLTSFAAAAAAFNFIGLLHNDLDIVDCSDGIISDIKKASMKEAIAA
jgi:hypothetical protein